jgi:hypothetical protein
MKLAILFRPIRASPQLHIIEEIDALKKSGCEVITHAATAENIRAFVAIAGCHILYMSMHCGFVSIGRQKQKVLFLEDGRGGAHMFPACKLRELLAAGQKHQHIDIVFLSTCHSLSIGEDLVTAGVRHVICVRNDDEVRIKDSRLFAQHFFAALNSGYSVHEAYICGRDILRHSPDCQGAESLELLPKVNSHDVVYCARR